MYLIVWSYGPYALTSHLHNGAIVVVQLRAWGARARHMLDELTFSQLQRRLGSSHGAASAWGAWVART